MPISTPSHHLFSLPLYQPAFRGVTWVNPAENPNAPSQPYVWKAGGQTANHGKEGVLLEVRLPGSTDVTVIPMAAEKVGNNRYFQPKTQHDNLIHLAGDTFYYRFRAVDGSTSLDFTEQTDLGEGDTWNVARRPKGPQKSGSLLYAYVDSHLPSQSTKIDTLSAPPLIQATTTLGGNLQGVMSLLDKLNDSQQQAIGGVMLTPHTGDWATPHRYQTADPFVLNEAFADFDQLLTKGFAQGVKIYADGAFVNAGFESPLYQSLLRHGARSPYWRWFLFDDNQANPATGHQPDVAANSSLVLGTLPVTSNTEGGWQVDWQRLGLRIENHPNQPNYQPGQPTVLVQFDPTEEADKNGTDWQPPEATQQAHRWPVDPAQLTQRLNNNGLPLDTAELTGETAAPFLAWKHFRLGRPDEDNSGHKWDGKVPAIRMDLTNPEALSYAQNALTYWTQRGYSLALTHVANGLRSQASDNNDWHAAIEQLYQSGVLPKPNEPIRLTAPKSVPAGETPTGKELTNALWRNVPLLSIPLPRESLALKATLAWPQFSEAVLNHAGLGGELLSGLGKLVGNGGSSQTVNALLGEQLSKLIETLPPQAQQAASKPAGLDILMAAIGPKIIRLLLTNQQSDDPSAITAGLQTVFGPQALLAVPKTAAPHIRKALKAQAKHLPILNLKAAAETALANLSPEALDVAAQVVKHHELGLNWRLDAAKDIANVDAARNQPNDDAKHNRFQQEMGVAKNVWTQLLSGARKIFPAMAVVAEMTDIGPLAGSKKRSVLDGFLAGGKGKPGIFTGITNMDYFFSGLLRLIHHDPTPNQSNKRQMHVQAEGDEGHVAYHSFWDAIVKPFVTETPKSAATFSQTLTASHDYATTLSNLLRNPIIQDRDHATYRGLEEDTRDVLNAMAYRADFEPFRQQLKSAGVKNPGKALNQLSNLLNSLELPDHLKPMATNQAKDNAFKTHYETGKLIKAPPNSPDFRKTYGEALLKKALGSSEISRPLKTALQQPDARNSLLNALTLPGEVWATRALLTNGFESFKSQAKPPAAQFYEALNTLQEQFAVADPKLPGYLSLARWVEDLGTAVWPDNAAKQKQFKQDLFAHTLQPALEKDQRRLALMVALPGQPTWYDVFRTGGETANNRYLQNREGVRLDWLSDSQVGLIQQALQANRAILALRQQYPVINHGELQNLSQDAENGVLIAAWDGGPVIPTDDTDGGPEIETSPNVSKPATENNGIAGQQVIVLVNTGQPTRLPDSEYNQTLGSGTEKTYPALPTTQLVLKNYRANIAQLHQPVGTRYKDAATGDVYIVDKAGNLVLEDDKTKNNSTQGTSEKKPKNSKGKDNTKSDLHVYRVLVRQ